MRFMVLLKTTAGASANPTRAMRAYDRELQRAGMTDRARLSARGARLATDVADGRMLAGFWIFDLNSRDDAAAWMRRCPSPADRTAVIEIRLLLEPADLADRPVARPPRSTLDRTMAM